MHKFSIAAPKLSDLPALHSVSLLNVLQRVRLRGPLSRALPGRRFRRFVDENLCIIRTTDVGDSRSPFEVPRFRLRVDLHLTRKPSNFTD